jgi:aspartate ammonia-lyase
MPIPEKAYYGIQTTRATQNFAVSGHAIDELPVFIGAIAVIKKAAALANRDIGVLDDRLAGAICQAADEIIEGRFGDAFPIDIFQGGGSTSTNMNVNEVIANRANEILTGQKGYDTVHPNTHVNMGQSTNDVIPSAMSLSCHRYITDLLGSLTVLERSLSAKVEEFADAVKVARTCIQDAVPITLGQEFGGYLAFVRRQREKLAKARDTCVELPLGATAVGTGLGAFQGYHAAVFQHLAELTGLPVCQKQDLFDGLQNADSYLDVSGALKSLATGLGKMARDLRLMSSGPRSGFNEIGIPAVQPGSSIMPGKINPVMPELINQICYQVCGNDVAITMAAEGGELDLNVWEPVIIKCLSESFRLLTNGILRFVDYCVDGITANRAACRDHAENCLAISTVIAAVFGYDTGTVVAKEAYRTGRTVRDVAIALELLSPEDADALLNPLMLTDQAQSGAVLAMRKRQLVVVAKEVVLGDAGDGGFPAEG